MMKRFISIIAIISILLLINSSGLAEPLKKELDNRLFNGGLEELLIDDQNPMILSVDRVKESVLGMLLREYKEGLDLILTESKDMIRFKLNSSLAFRDSGEKISRLEYEGQEEAVRERFTDDFILIRYNWDGKDRIISLDFEEDNSSDILNLSY